MSGHEYLATAAIVFRDVFVSPGHGCRSVVENNVDRSLGQQTVVGCDNHETAVLQLRVNMLVAALDATAVEPDYDRRVLGICRIIHIELAALLGITLCRLAIRDVVHLIVLRPCSASKEQHENGEKSLSHFHVGFI